MAIDTRDRRASAIGLQPVFTQPLPDGSVDDADRWHITWVYRGLAAVAPPTPVSGAITAVADTFGDVAISHPLAATSMAVANTTGNLTISEPGALAGNIRSVAETAGDLTVNEPSGLAGIITAVAETSGDFTLTHPIVGAITAVANTAGNIPIGVFTPNPCRICTPPKSNPICVSTEC